jgi:hypothetical protein
VTPVPKVYPIPSHPIWHVLNLSLIPFPWGCMIGTFCVVTGSGPFHWRQGSLGNFFDPMMSITVITQITVAISWLNYTNYANYSDYANYGGYIWRGQIWITWLRQLRRHFFPEEFFLTQLR